MSYKLYELGSNLEMNFINSKEHDKVKKEYLPGGIINVLQDNIMYLYNSLKVYADNFRKYTVIHLSNEEKTIIIITIYHILQSLNAGACTALSQYNQSDT